MEVLSMQSFVPKWLVFGDRFDSMTIGVRLSQSQRVWVKQTSSSKLCCSNVYSVPLRIVAMYIDGGSVQDYPKVPVFAIEVPQV